MNGVRSGRRNPRVWGMALEPRLMFDGAAMVEAAHAVDDAAVKVLMIPAVAMPVTVREADPSKDGGKKEVAFIDTSIADYKSLEANIRPGVEIVEMGGGQRGLAQMAAWAEIHGGFDAIHVLSHGSEGALYLGTDVLTRATLPSGVVRVELAVVGQALKTDGDLLIYGCSVGAGESGAAFVADLATLTGADVAASTDATGSPVRGGNWTLETQVGSVATPSFSFENYDGLLPTTTTTYDGTLTTDNTYNRPWTPFDVAYAADPNNLGGRSSDDVYTGNAISQTSPTSYNYTVATFTPTSGGTFSFSVTAADIIGYTWDPTDVFMSIYNGSFSPTSPLSNLYYVNDDTAVGQSDYKPTIPNVALVAGSNYIVVMTAFDSGVTGTYTFAVTGPSGGTWTAGAVSAPIVSSVTSTKADGSYKAGEVIDITVNLSAAVNVTGTPQLTLETGTTDRMADYVAAASTATALVFRYTVQAGDTSADLDYAATTSLALNGGTIKAQGDNTNAVLTLATPGAADSLGANKAIVIDTTAPATPTVAISSDTGTITTDGYTATTAQTITITAEGGATLDIDYGDGSPHGSANGAHTYAAGKYTISATATDAAGNTSTAGTKVIVVDTAAPTDVTASTVALGTAAATNGSVFCTLTAVDATNIAGYTDTWTYAITGGADQGKFTIANGNELTINNAGGLSAGSYTVQVTATDAVGNSYAKTLNLSVVSAPAVSSVTSTKADGSYKAGEVIDITVTMSAAVNVTGTPQLTLETGTTDRVADYVAGSSTATGLVFRYTVQAGDTSADLDYVATTSLALNGGTIKA
ncbi:MAG: DUF4347 domain-containing protein, partial [Magnetococcales bacterium]|nr:DUF4347 domain-containing protein [Magnetococcales bacterium]